MKQQAIWIESEHAYIYELHESNFDRVKVTNHDVHHHGNHAKDVYSLYTPYFKNIVAHIKDHELIILGHAQCKDYFKKYLESHHPDISKRVYAYLTKDKMTDREIIATARKEFSNHEMDQILS